MSHTFIKNGKIAFVGAGPGDPDLLTVKALKALQSADVILHDRLVSDEILALAGPRAQLIYVGKEGFGPSVAQGDINAEMVAEARAGHAVVRLKAGDPTVYGRLDEEIDAADAAGIAWTIIPGITAAPSAVAEIGQSLTKRGRNAALQFLAAHDMEGFADHDWRRLAQDGAVAAIYMGKKAARFVQGRLLMHGASAATPVTVIENASRPDQRILATTIGTFAGDLAAADLAGPAITFLGLAPRAAEATLAQQETA